MSDDSARRARPRRDTVTTGEAIPAVARKSARTVAVIAGVAFALAGCGSASHTASQPTRHPTTTAPSSSTPVASSRTAATHTTPASTTPASKAPVRSSVATRTVAVPVDSKYALYRELFHRAGLTTTLDYQTRSDVTAIAAKECASGADHQTYVDAAQSFDGGTPRFALDIKAHGAILLAYCPAEAVQFVKLIDAQYPTIFGG